MSEAHEFKNGWGQALPTTVAVPAAVVPAAAPAAAPVAPGTGNAVLDALHKVEGEIAALAKDIGIVPQG